MSSPFRVTFEHGNDGTRESGEGRDLSLGGVFIETSRMLPVGAFVALEIEAGTSKAAIDGRVMSCREKPEGPDQPQGIAIRFIDLPNDVASTLSFMIATRMPRKGTTLGLGAPEDGIEQYESARSLPAAGDVGLRPAASSMRIPIDEQAIEDGKPAPLAAPAPQPGGPHAAQAMRPAPTPAPPPAARPVSEPPRKAPSKAPLLVVGAAVVVVLVCLVVLLVR